LNDTSPEMERRVAAHYAGLSPFDRMSIAASMRQTAIAIIDSSLPLNLTREQRRYAIAKRLYGNELPEAALIAHANFGGIK